MCLCVCVRKSGLCVRERQRAERLRGGESICRGTNAGQHVNRLLLRAQSRERERERWVPLFNSGEKFFEKMGALRKFYSPILYALQVHLSLIASSAS